MSIPSGGIGFFDSGIGGMTVLSACMERFDGGVFYYYGDNDRAPYGNLASERIYAYTKEAFDEFARLKSIAAVVACNTATAVAVERLRKEYSFPIIGAEPAVMEVAKLGGVAYVLTTRTTHENERFKKLCMRARTRYPATTIIPIACDGLAGEIEKHLTDENYNFTACLPRGSPTSVALGCTHYVYLKKTLESFYGCACLDGNDGIARRLCSCMSDFFLKNRDRQPRGDFLWDGRPPAGEFDKNALGENVLFIKKEEKANGKKFSILKNPEKIPQNRPFFQLFFLGSGKKRNKYLYEQMFV